ncbi:MAG: YjbQ family protein, partial [Anaerolineaceae bacterium]
MTVKTVSLEFSTRGNADIIDITDQIAASIHDTEIANGIVTVFCPSSTSAVTTIEHENGCFSDLRRLFDEILDPKREYAHNSRWGDGNGHS